jgi:hypothetical protein
MADGIVYTEDEMANVRAAVNALREVMKVVFTPALLLEGLGEMRAILDPGNLPDYDSGLAKLRQEPEEVLWAWLSGRADWWRRGEDAFTIDMKKGDPRELEVARERGWLRDARDRPGN